MTPTQTHTHVVIQKITQHPLLFSSFWFTSLAKTEAHMGNSLKTVTFKNSLKDENYNRTFPPIWFSIIISSYFIISRHRLQLPPCFFLDLIVCPLLIMSPILLPFQTIKTSKVHSFFFGFKSPRQLTKVPVVESKRQLWLRVLILHGCLQWFIAEKHH